MIDLAPRYLNMVKVILNAHLHDGQKVYVFGSRACVGDIKKASKYSDLDLCIDGTLTFAEMATLKDSFSESDLPYFVDIVLKKRLSDEFYSLIKDDLLTLAL